MFVFSFSVSFKFYRSFEQLKVIDKCFVPLRCFKLICFVGFGSMLRALGAQIEKTTNREACRDLSGRRLRDVNHENQ